MGIAHLATHLRPFGVSKKLEGQDVVIDGPALTYHVYHMCCASQPRARNPFEAIPSYKIIGDTIIDFLDELSYHGATIKKIYFDGFLPASKRDVRTSRMMSYTKQLSNYHDSWPQVIPQSLTQPGQLESALFDLKIGSSCASQIPAAPFIVPAVIETLKTTATYGLITEVVPDEADRFCAAYVRLHAGLVLTSDSDLLIHNLGCGSVAFLRDIERSGPDGDLRVVEYEPAKIASRLGLQVSSGLQNLAFEIMNSPNRTFAQSLQRASHLTYSTAISATYEDFIQQYTPIDSRLISLSRIDQTAEPFPVLIYLDPRISEYVLQVEEAFVGTQYHSLLAKHKIMDKKIDVYLPFLLDCPSRTSAWEVSAMVRQLSYGLMNILLSPSVQVRTVVEHRRQQSFTQGREWQLPVPEEIPKACEDLASLIKSFHHSLGKIPEISIWGGVAIYQDLSHGISVKKVSLSEKLILQSSRSNVSSMRISWDVIHFWAQLQGSYYSFRMLKQILEVVLKLMNAPTSSYLINLRKALDSLPPISELLTLYETISETSTGHNLNSLRYAQKLLGVGDNKLGAAGTEKTSKTKRRRGKMNGRGKNSSTSSLSNNVYDILKVD